MGGWNPAGEGQGEVVVDLVGELAGKVAIVTGSARNIGRATAVELARGGASLVINARQKSLSFQTRKGLYLKDTMICYLNSIYMFNLILK